MQVMISSEPEPMLHLPVPQAPDCQAPIAAGIWTGSGHRAEEVQGVCRPIRVIGCKGLYQ